MIKPKLSVNERVADSLEQLLKRIEIFVNSEEQIKNVTFGIIRFQKSIKAAASKFQHLHVRHRVLIA